MTKPETFLTPAKELRARLNDEVTAIKAAIVEQGIVEIKKKIEENWRMGEINVPSLMPEVVEALKAAGYGVRFSKAMSCGDVDMHSISW